MMMNMILIILVVICMAAIGLCKAIADSIQDDGDYRTKLWKRKYFVNERGHLLSVDSMNFWELFRMKKMARLYYRMGGLKYKERFFLSATVLVFVTDEWHFYNWLRNRITEMMVCLLMGEMVHILWLWAPGALLFNIIYVRRNKQSK